MKSASKSSCSIFCQTDRKIDGQLASKAHLVFKAAERAGVHCLWHKIVLRHEIGAIDLYRPGFTHLIAVSHTLTSGTPTPDVIKAGKPWHRYGAGIEAARFAVEFAKRSTDRLVDPFCGHGTFVHIAAQLGMSALGIDISPEQIRTRKRIGHYFKVAAS
jgi:hypothetical protein